MLVQVELNGVEIEKNLEKRFHFESVEEVVDIVKKEYIEKLYHESINNEHNASM